ncbi:hypothetical protein ACFV4N_35615 [Actinosynnema sp. NPDC059797]
MSGGTWRALPLAVVRSAGFPATLVDRLADPELLAAIDRARTARAELDALAAVFDRAAAEGSATGPDQVRVVRTTVRAVHRRRALPEPAFLPAGLGTGSDAGFAARWAEQVRARDEAEVAVGAAFPTTLAAARAHLARELTEPRLREALYLLTPEILDNAVRSLLRRPPKGPAPNQNERKVVAFAQRLATKCETNAFLGPIAYATTGEPVGGPAERRGFLAFRVAQELLRAASARLDPHRLTWRRGPGASHLPAGSSVRSAVDAAVAGRTGAVPAEVLRALRAKDVIWADELLVPTSEPDALASIGRAARALGDHDLAAVHDRLRECASTFATADAEGKAKAVAVAEGVLADVGVDAGRTGHGRLYADRSVLYEDDHEPDLGITLSPDGLDRIVHRLAPVLHVAATAGRQAWETARERFATEWAARHGEAAELPLAEVLRTLPTSFEAPLSATPAARALHDEVLRQWDGLSDHVVLDPVPLRAAVDSTGRGTGGDEPLLMSPDLHFDTADRRAVADGSAPVVVGEIHAGLQALGNLCAFVADRDALAEAVRRWVGTGPELVHVATRSRFGKLCFLELLPRTLELSGPAAAGRDRLGVDDLAVRADGTVVDRHTGRRVLPLFGDPDAATQTPIGPPSCALPRITLGARTPRLSIGDVVVQRATWTVEAAELAAPNGSDGVERYRTAARVLRDHGVPRRCFASFPDERKPVYVDLAAPHLVDLLVSTAKDGAVRLTEMLPVPDGWQRGGVACELRFSVTTGGDHG